MCPSRPFDILPTYSDKDFVVVQRKSEKGLWKSEVWTKRDFEPFEIQLGPYSSQLKETHLMGSAHALVGLAKNGRGAHPGNQSLALDCCGRNLMAHKGDFDSEVHQGSWYWLVSRACKPSDANLTLDNVTFEFNLKLNLPAPKRRKTESQHLEPSELPSLPIMVNKGKIKKHLQLLVYQPERKEEKKAQAQ